jgi:thiol:disulfide interchange protein DsbA
LADKLNHPAFSAVMDQRINIGDPTVLASWLKSQPGVNVSQFMATYNSFGINAKVAAATQMTKDYAIQGTPTIVINGKYAIIPAQPDALMQRMKDMIVMARKEIKKS